MINELRGLLNENDISHEDQEKIIKGFNAISFDQRKNIFDAMKGHPGLIVVFIENINKKINLIRNSESKSADSIIREEESLLEDSIKNI